MKFAWILPLPLPLLLPVLASPFQDPVPTLRSETRVVQIDVAVRDAHGHAVDGLVKEDFKVSDNGKPRAITIFSAGPATPGGEPSDAVSLPPGVFSNRTPSPAQAEHVTVILLDSIMGKFDDFAPARQSALRAMARLPGKERVAIYAVYMPGIYAPPVLSVVQDFTSDRELLRRSIAAYRQPFVVKPKAGMPRSSSARTRPDATAMAVQQMSSVADQAEAYYAVEDKLDTLRKIGEHLALVPGRKSLIWVTAGFTSAALPMRDETIATLNDANVALSAVDMRGLTVGAAPGIGGMQSLAEATGGQAYSGVNDLDGAILDAMDASRTNYSLGFYLDDSERDGAFHKLTVQVSRPGLELHYRQGYTAEKVSAKLPAPKEDLDAALLNPVDANAVGISASVEVVPGQPHATLRLTLSLDSHGLSLRQEGAESTGKVDEEFIELDERGAALGHTKESKTFEMPGSALDHFYSAGLKWDQDMPLMPGAARVRVIVRDSATGRLGSLTVPVGRTN